MKRFFSLIPFTMISLLAPDMGGGSGGSSSSEPTPEQPQGDTPEAKYTSALKIIGDYFKQLSGAMKEKDDAVFQVAGLNAQIKSLTADKEKLTSDLGSLTSERDGLKDQVTGANDRATKAEGRTTLIESFAKHNGLDLAGLEKFKALKEVPAAEGAKDGKALYDEWQRLKASGDGKKATAFSRKHKAELAEYAESTR